MRSSQRKTPLILHKLIHNFLERFPQGSVPVAMKLKFTFLLVYTFVFAHGEKEDLPDLWNEFRGPNANGVVPSAKPPTHWSEKKNIRWKVPIDGAGASTPIIWKDKIFLLSVINTGKVDPSLPRPEDQPKRVFDITHPNTEFKFLVLCLNRKNGKE